MEYGKTSLRKVAQDISQSLGKVPPQAIDIEEAVLGAIMLEKDAIYTAIQMLPTAEAFYRDTHKEIYKAILALNQEGEPVDMRNVPAKLRKMGKLEFVGGSYYIAELTSKISSAANIQSHCALIKEYFLKREIIREASEAARLGYDETIDPFELIDLLYEALNTLSNFVHQGSQKTAKELVVANIDDLDKAMNEDKPLRGITTGYTALNDATGGWQDSELIIVAARPGMGKSGFALTSALAAAQDNPQLPVVVFSLEMSAKRLILRLQSQAAEIEVSKLIKAKIARGPEFEALIHKSQPVSLPNLIIIDDTSLTVTQMRAILYKIKREWGGMAAVFVDYLQLMEAPNIQKREEQISFISRNLKTIAKTLECPVVALSQLSRAVETRGGDRRPQLSDLRESGSIEQNADMVIFLYRPEYYKIDETEDGSSTRGYAQAIIAKFRDGSLDDIPLKFVGKFIKFADWDQGQEDDENDMQTLIPIDEL